MAASAQKILPFLPESQKWKMNMKQVSWRGSGWFYNRMIVRGGVVDQLFWGLVWSFITSFLKHLETGWKCPAAKAWRKNGANWRHAKCAIPAIASSALHGTVDGRNLAPVEVGSLSHYFQGFIHPGGAGFLPSTVGTKKMVFPYRICLCHPGIIFYNYEVPVRIPPPCLLKENDTTTTIQLYTISLYIFIENMK